MTAAAPVISPAPCSPQPAGMVVHISPGHASGTLVNALLHHCGLGPLEVASGSQAPLGLADSLELAFKEGRHRALVLADE